MKTAIMFIYYCLFAVPYVQANQPTTPALSATEYALQLIKETCAPHAAQAANSLESADLALYCFATGKAIALQASQTASEKKAAQQTINRWMESIQPALAAK